MRHSRYVWLLGITLMCLLGITAWKSPQAVMVALVKPQHADSPRVAVQRFWGYLDSRQLDLAEQLVLGQEMNPLDKHEVDLWKERVERNPLLNLKNLDLEDTKNPNSLIVRVNWTSPLKEQVLETYAIELRETPEGWKIFKMKQVSEQSLAKVSQ